MILMEPLIFVIRMQPVIKKKLFAQNLHHNPAIGRSCDNDPY